MRHDIDGLSLVLGLVFGLVAVGGLNDWIDPDVFRLEWLLPAVLVTLGLVLLGLLASRLGRRDQPIEALSAGDPAGDEQAPAD